MEINADLLEKEAYEIKEEQKQEEKQQEYLAQSDDEQIEIRERQSIHIGGHKEPMMEGFREASIKDEIDELAGEIPKGPQYVGMDSKFAVVQKDDSDRMREVREALALYHSKESKFDESEKLRRLIRACDNYSIGRFRLFKWGRGKDRLKEVLALKREAVSRLADQERIAQKTDMIYNLSGDEITMSHLNAAGLPKRIIAASAAVLSEVGVTAFKALTLQFLWKKDFTWTPPKYYAPIVRYLDYVFGRTVTEETDDGRKVKKRLHLTRTSRRKKDASETYARERLQNKADEEALKEGLLDDDYDEEQVLDEGYDKEKKLLDLKKKLIAAYSERNANASKIADMEGELESLTKDVAVFVRHMEEYHPEDGFNLDSHRSIDKNLKKQKQLYENARQIEILREQGLASQERLKNEATSDAF